MQIPTVYYVGYLYNTYLPYLPGTYVLEVTEHVKWPPSSVESRIPQRQDRELPRSRGGILLHPSAARWGKHGRYRKTNNKKNPICALGLGSSLPKPEARLRGGQIRWGEGKKAPSTRYGGTFVMREASFSLAAGAWPLFLLAGRRRTWTWHQDGPPGDPRVSKILPQFMFPSLE